MKQQSKASKCSTNASDIVLDSSPVHSFLRANSGNSLFRALRPILTEDAVRRHIPCSLSALTRVSFRQNKIQNPKARGNMLAIRVKTAEVQRITTPLPLLPAFLVASHITEIEGVVSVIIGLLRRDELLWARRLLLREQYCGRRLSKAQGLTSSIATELPASLANKSRGVKKQQSTELNNNQASL